MAPQTGLERESSTGTLTVARESKHGRRHARERVLVGTDWGCSFTI
jgi:hypothetical protein